MQKVFGAFLIVLGQLQGTRAKLRVTLNEEVSMRQSNSLLP